MHKYINQLALTTRSILTRGPARGSWVIGSVTFQQTRGGWLAEYAVVSLAN
jgi:hypothetical protein